MNIKKNCLKAFDDLKYLEISHKEYMREKLSLRHLREITFGNASIKIAGPDSSAKTMDLTLYMKEHNSSFFPIIRTSKQKLCQQ